MQSEETSRGFIVVEHETYGTAPKMDRLIQESSAVGNYENSLSAPGSSFLWVGDNHHLNREEVAELIARMQQWLDVGRLSLDAKT